MLTSHQRAVLEYMRGSALKIVGRWVWPVDIIEDPALAIVVYWRVLS